MKRYRVTVTTKQAYLIDKLTPEAATAQGIAMAKARIKPDYVESVVADVDVVAETTEGAKA